MIIMEITIRGEDKRRFKEIRLKLYEIYDVSLPNKIDFNLKTEGWLITIPEVSKISDTTLVNIIENIEGQR